MPLRVASRLKRLLPPPVFRAVALVACRLASLAEWLVWGGERRGRLLTRLLAGHLNSVARRHWLWIPGAEDAPHFMDHRHTAFGLAFGTTTAEVLTRGFYSAEVIRPGDIVLDIGCGDGFFDHRFFAPRCEHVDGIDIEPTAIAAASRHNAAPNISYHLLDAVHDPFPRDRYDVVVWDGALGHFAPETTSLMLRKVRAALASDGVFVGSESLGRSEGHDHLQFFETLDELGEVLSREFTHVLLRVVSYPLSGGLEREEALWRCAESPARLADGWTVKGRIRRGGS